MFLFNKNGKGFTIIELIIVISLTLVVFLIIYDVYLVSHKAFGRGDVKLELLQNGRIVLDRLTRELRQTQEIVTQLPATKIEIGFPPPNEIQFQDGHGLENIQYLKYLLIDHSLIHQRIIYYFPEEPDNYVYWNAKDEFGNPPISNTLENKVIAEYINNLAFYGNSLINVEIWLAKNNVTEHLYSGVWGRNTR